MKLQWHEKAWQDYLLWQNEDKKTLKKINALIKGIQRNDNSGIGKPEPLKDDKSGWCSRRIDEKNRIVYKVENNSVIIASCKGHYGDKWYFDNM